MRSPVLRKVSVTDCGVGSKGVMFDQRLSVCSGPYILVLSWLVIKGACLR